MKEQDELGEVVTRAHPAAPGWMLEEHRALAAVEERLFGSAGEEPLRLGRYVLLERLATGGVGTVYAGFDPELDRRVAIKLLLPRTGLRSEEERNRLMREAQAVAKLGHPNVVTIHDIGTYVVDSDSGDEKRTGLFLVMELINGPTLAEWLVARERDWQEILRVFRAAGRGLLAAHNEGLVHRDFKPQNVMIDSDGRVRVLDFGLARLITAPSGPHNVVDTGVGFAPSDFESRSSGVLCADLTEEGAVMGTPAYMAPEQHGGRPVDARTDQFSFCVALFEALFGKNPFGGSSMSELAAAKENGEIIEVGLGRVPMAVHRALIKGLRRDPEERFAGMTELLSALEGPRIGRRWWVAGGVVGFSVLAAVASGSTEPSTQELGVCSDVGARMESVWDANTRQSVHDAFMASGHAQAEELLSQAGDYLDHFRDKWIEQRKGSCQLGLSDDPNAVAVAQRRNACLESKLRIAEEVVNTLMNAEEADVAHTREIVRELGSLSGCEDDLALKNDSPSSQNADQHSEVQALLARTRARRLANKFEEAVAAAREAVRLSETTSDPEQHTQALFALAWVLGGMGELEEAEASVRRGWEVAEQHGLSTMALRAVVDLTVMLFERGRYLEARRLLDVANAKAAQVDVALGLQGDLAFASGRLFEALGRTDEAIDDYSRAFQLRQEFLGYDHVGTGWAAIRLATVYLDLGSPQRAEPYVEVAKQAYRARFETDSPEMAEVVEVSAELELANGGIDVALEKLETSRALLAASERPDRSVEVRLAKALGKAWFAKGDYERSAEVIDRGHTRCVQLLDDEHPVCAVLEIEFARALIELDELPRAADALRSARARLESLPHPHAVHPQIEVLEGSIVARQGDLEGARQRFERAITELEASVNAAPLMVARARAAFGRALLEAGQTDTATSLLSAALDGFPAAVAGLERANTAMHLAGSLIESNPEQARTLLADAGADYEQANVQPPAELNRALRRLGGERKALARGDASELRFERLRPLFVRPLGLLDPLGLLEWLRSS